MKVRVLGVLSELPRDRNTELGVLQVLECFLKKRILRADEDVHG
jgi:hypothetical protein